MQDAFDVADATLVGSADLIATPPTSISAALIDEPNIGAGAIGAALPAMTLYPGDTFDLTVSSFFERKLQAFTADLLVSEGLEIVRIVAASNFEGPQPGIAEPERRDGRAALVRAGAPPSDVTNDLANPEPLLEVTLLVTPDFVAPHAAQVSLSLVRAADVEDRLVFPAVAGAPLSLLMTRTGVTRNTGTVYIAANTVQGFLAWWTVPQMVNTAVLDAAPVSSTLTIRGAFSRQGHLSSLSAPTCALHPSLVAGVIRLNACEATLVGTEVRGGIGDVVVTVGGWTRQVPIAVLFPNLPLSMEPRDDELSQVRGWFTDEECSQLRFQDTDIIAKAIFAAGVGLSFEADVSTRINAQLISAAPTIAALSMPGIVQGVAPGQTTIRAVNAMGLELGECDISVSGGDGVIDAVQLNVVVSPSLGAASTYSTGSGQFQSVAISLSPLPPSFRYASDSAAVLAAVRFSDGSLHDVGSADGLGLESLAPLSLTAEADRVRVPSGGHVSANGKILRAAWTPAPLCGTLITADVELTVQVPQALRLEASPAALNLVPREDVGADFWQTQHQLRLDLVFDDRRLRRLQGDARARYAVEESSIPGLITVTSSGLVVANSAGLDGTATIRVSFDGQGATDTVVVSVGRYADLVISCRSWPRSSDGALINTLSRIGTEEPPQWEQGLLDVQMILTDGRAPYTFGGYDELDFSIVDAASGQSSEAITISVSGPDARVSVQYGPAAVLVTPSYKEVSGSRGLLLQVLLEPVFIESLDAMRFFQNGRVTSTFGGEQHVATGHVQFDATLSNGRLIPDFFSPLGTPRLAGQIQLTSSSPDTVSIDPVSGEATLHANSYELVALGAEVLGAELGSVGVAANLEPTEIGDLDLGARVGLAAPPASVGSQFALSVSVNTGAMILGAFNIIIRYDQSRLLVSPEGAVVADLSGGTVIATLAYSTGVDADGWGVIQIAGSLDPSALKGQRSVFLAITFDVFGDPGLFPAVIPFDVEVLTLEDNAIPARSEERR